MTQPDVVLIGGGVIGLTTALKLAERGVSVTILERRATGREASWAGAGMLPPGNLSRAQTPEARLRSYSHAMWKAFSAELREQTGIDNGYHVCGAIDVFTPDSRHEFDVQFRTWTNEGLRVELLSPGDAERHVTDLNSDFANVCYLPDFGQVRNPRHLQAVRAACLRRGVEIVEHAEDLHITTSGDRVTEIRAANRSFQFDKVCITAGAWSATLLQSRGVKIPVKPVRGQIVQLQLPAQPFRCVIEHGRRYLVPRKDGLILIGSTEEDAGFVKQNTTEGVSELLKFATSLVPSLAQAEVVQSWAGLRPASPDELPLLGLVPGYSNLLVGTGHFRSGLQTSPGTATILADLLLESTPGISMEGLTADRFEIAADPDANRDRVGLM